MTLILSDDEILSQNCSHQFKLQSAVTVEKIIYDIYFCSRCLLHVKKERPCPLHLASLR
ncbi:MAG TPA: hypothetical protein VJK03_04620 [Candidatus Nanoarchaeia archaeon]|nr:hypothetical protein [Candidatus Nanoarchaeia archaeon]